ncbi:MAG: hypothetical protein R8N23_10480 [Reichenbachiella sp.]|uniref:hypothetical protein n=1 Tax=Reichenbachiella sp. TaxID=2184521 RepID=UPI002965D4A1|nr:hypothetical protein [Reichenbachiella sp.]MDW3210284.1 hypothetical protein [Reichenbachiella sp.]
MTKKRTTEEKNTKSVLVVREIFVDENDLSNLQEDAKSYNGLVINESANAIKFEASKSAVYDKFARADVVDKYGFIVPTGDEVRFADTKSIEEEKNLSSGKKKLVVDEKLKKKYPEYSSDIKKLFNSFMGGDLVEFEDAIDQILSKKEEGRLYKHGNRGNKEAADNFAREMFPHMIEAKKHANTYDEIAHYFNAILNLRTRRGKLFNNTAVIRLERKQKELGLKPDQNYPEVN